MQPAKEIWQLALCEQAMLYQICPFGTHCPCCYLLLGSTPKPANSEGKQPWQSADLDAGQVGP